MVFYSRNGRLEYDLIGAPGADLTSVHFRILHARASLSPGGDILLTDLRSHKPAPLRLKRASAYQPLNSTSASPRRATLNASYALRGDNLSFTLPAYDHSRPLIIDPALIFSTYLGSNCAKCSDLVAGLAVDSTGIYLTGSTDATSFPADANEPASDGNSRTFVVKLNPSASQILYETFLGGSSGSAIAVDSTGSPYVTGLATVPASSVNSFPLTSGVYSHTVPASLSATGIAYATKLSSNGSQIVYSTLLQKPYPVGTISYSNYAVPSNIAVDSQGALYMTGTVFIDVDAQGIGEWQTFSTTPGAFQTGGGVFALKLAPAATGFQYSTYLDGVTANGTDEPEDLGIAAAGIAVDTNGDAFLTGTGESGFPTTSGVYDPTTTVLSAYLMEMNPTGTAPIFSTLYADGSSSNGLALDSQGEPVIVGTTVAGSPVPVTSNAFCGVPANFNSLGFVAKFSAGGTGLVYSTTLCAAGTAPGDGTGNSGGNGVAVDSTGAAYVTGFTDDPASFQSILSQPVRAYSIPDYINQLALKLDTSGNLQWATFLGANQAAPDDQFGLAAIDTSNAMYVLYYQDNPIQTLINFPTTPDTVGLRNEGPGESGGNFLLKIAPSLGSPAPLPSPNFVAFPGQPIGSSSSSVDVQIGNYGDAPVTPSSVTVTGDFSEVDTCSASVPPGGKCDVNVTFSPTVAGAVTGTLTIDFTGATSVITVPLRGTGTVAGVSLSPSSLSFGMEPNGTASAAQQITVTNSGSASLTITSTVATSEFNATNTCGAPHRCRGHLHYPSPLHSNRLRLAIRHSHHHRQRAQQPSNRSSARQSAAQLRSLHR